MSGELRAHEVGNLHCKFAWRMLSVTLIIRILQRLHHAVNHSITPTLAKRFSAATLVASPPSPPAPGPPWPCGCIGDPNPVLNAIAPPAAPLLVRCINPAPCCTCAPIAIGMPPAGKPIPSIPPPIPGLTTPSPGCGSGLSPPGGAGGGDPRFASPGSNACEGGGMGMLIGNALLGRCCCPRSSKTLDGCC